MLLWWWCGRYMSICFKRSVFSLLLFMVLVIRHINVFFSFLYWWSLSFIMSLGRWPRILYILGIILFFSRVISGLWCLWVITSIIVEIDSCSVLRRLHLIYSLSQRSSKELHRTRNSHNFNNRKIRRPHFSRNCYHNLETFPWMSKSVPAPFLPLRNFANMDLNLDLIVLVGESTD